MKILACFGYSVRFTILIFSKCSFYEWLNKGANPQNMINMLCFKSDSNSYQGLAMGKQRKKVHFPGSGQIRFGGYTQLYELPTVLDFTPPGCPTGSDRCSNGWLTSLTIATDHPNRSKKRGTSITEWLIPAL